MSNKKDLNGYRKYFLGILKELEIECEKRPAWMFLCCSAFIEYLAKMSTDPSSAEKRDWIPYMLFIEKYMPERYKKFKYLVASSSVNSAAGTETTKSDLPLQMYCILRCGLVHSFSLVPHSKYGTSTAGSKARKRSIVLTHRGVKKRVKHLDNYKGKDGNQDAALFVLQDFIKDIRKALKALFKDAETDSALGEHILKNLSDCPPLKTLF